jgi:CRP-like cAMP-binding protein
MEMLHDYFARLGFQDDGLQRIEDAFSLTTFDRGAMLVEYGKTSRQIGLVKSGMFQYYIVKDGDEKTSYVSIEKTWLASLSSFLNERPAMENIRALSDSSIYLISKPELKTLIATVAGFKDFYIGLLEGSICGIDATRHDLLMLTAEQRYEKMLKDEPHLLQQIPLQHLASMLGVTPRHLSRIRSSIR